MALVIAGDRSGVGKTTVTLAILAFLAHQGKKIQSFKVGPDYIDPMFHSAVTGIPCRNLDPVLTSPEYIRQCFKHHVNANDIECAVVEGVMGLFDGIYDLKNPQSLNDYGSTAHIAKILNLPTVLVLDCSRLSTSIVAIAYGYANLDPKVKIAGVILNKVGSERHLELLETALKRINMPILGVLRRNSKVTIPDRHLGLIPTGEMPGITDIFAQLAKLAQVSFNWDKLFPLVDVDVASANAYTLRSNSSNSSTPKIKIAIARDAAFNFYYQDNLDMLKELGAELINWSPLKDKSIPKNIQGLYFGGGFPEMFAPQLAGNKRVLEQLKKIIMAGIPTYAECGGLMYLCDQLLDLEQKSWSMVGIIPSIAQMQPKLTLGYRKAIALKNTPLLAAQQQVIGHEFHRSQTTALSSNPLWKLQGFHKSSLQLTEGWQLYQLHASYLHLHWGENKHLPQRFIKYCQDYKI